MNKRNSIFWISTILLIGSGLWAFIGPAFSVVPIKLFLEKADSIPSSEIYTFSESQFHRPSATLVNSTLPWNYAPLMSVKKMIAGAYGFTDYVIDLSYVRELPASTFHVYSHVRDGDVCFIDIVGDKNSKDEISERRRLFQKAFPSLVIRARVEEAKIEEDSINSNPIK